MVGQTRCSMRPSFQQVECQITGVSDVAGWQLRVLGCAGHECDTDLCKGCTKSMLGVAGMVGQKCCNMRLRFRQHKRVAMGLSDVAGWGSFLLVCFRRSGPRSLINCICIRTICCTKSLTCWAILCQEMNLLAAHMCCHRPI